jgi:hypothetical protein
MAVVERVHEVRRALAKRLAKAQRENGTAAVVGYTAEYAVYVHENLEPAPDAKATARGAGQGKFLETPAREKGHEIGKVASQALRRGLPLEMALYRAGLRLQAISQDQYVPVDLGNLKASAFTRIEGARAFNPLGTAT